MRAPKWEWVGPIIDLLLLPPALYMAAGAIEIANQNSESLSAVAVAVLFSVLPIFCILAPWAAHRASRRGRSAIHLAALFAVPVIYAVFLLIFLFTA
jgi:hypothetical protein